MKMHQGCNETGSISDYLSHETIDISDDEPVILLRASQVGASEALMAMIAPVRDNLQAQGKTDSEVAKAGYQIRDYAVKIKDWQNRNPKLLKAI
jgi:hypothetical protein